MKHLLYILPIITLLACNKPAKPVAKVDYYHILNGFEDTSYNTLRDDPHIVAEKLFYGQHCFILLGDSDVYYFNEHSPNYDCGTGAKHDRPPYLYLTPDSIHKLNICQLDSFLNFIVNQKSIYASYDNIISIATTADTIRNSGYAIIRNNLENAAIKGAKLLCILRKPTEQERITLDYKLKKQAFYLEAIQWKELFYFPPPEIPKISKN